ncbi:MAG TPA: hypothetical protein VIM58_07835 [Candidatus Methylacidiphilales bacterium]
MGAVPHRIELNLADVRQLFNTIDPSPFPERDLDRNAEDFIVSWMREFPIDEPVELIVHLRKMPEGGKAKHLVEAAIHHYFAYRARLNRMEFRQLMRQGRTSLLVGLVFLGLCLGLARFAAAAAGGGAFAGFLEEGLTIAGWVAMWRPMEIYLYEWWPLRRRGAIFDKLSRVPVEVHKGIDPKADGLEEFA